jgi:hypothetical protein
MRTLFMNSVRQANTTILLGPTVILDFSDVKFPPDPHDPDNPDKTDKALMRVAPCVTVMSVRKFNLETLDPGRTDLIGDTISYGIYKSARTAHSLGPLLIFGPHRDGDKYFFMINCVASEQRDDCSDYVRFSGFRIQGPSFDQQSVDDVGIKIFRALEIEISNMEIAGWGGAGISVEDDPGQGPGQELPANHDGDRIGRPEQVKIFNNYIHHNQHPRGLWGSHALGYGVVVGHGAWAQIYQNVFDFNRHAIAASGDTGGYEAFRNLVLKGGGVHYDGFPTTFHTHQFDVHGSDGGSGGQAGIQFWYYENSFQYTAGPAIKIRGTPHIVIYIHDNTFAHEDLVGDAIEVDDEDDLGGKIQIDNNATHYDPFGHYGVCDFDGDGIDDLFLATGRTWWFSSAGEFQWTYLSARTKRLDQVRLGYFNDDQYCDVLSESGKEWVIASGGTGAWTSIGEFGASLDEVAFGRFDPKIRDHRPGVTKQTTHAFWRTERGEWLVTPLSNPSWEHAENSSYSLSKLRFGDFTGDGVTDVLANVGGHWSISKSARGKWQELNPDLDDPVASLFIADLDNNNIDDLIKLDWPLTDFTKPDWQIKQFTWLVSYDGRTPWQKLKTYHYSSDFTKISFPVAVFAGRFGAAPGGGILFIDRSRTGHFYSDAESQVGASPEWTSLYPY